MQQECGNDKQENETWNSEHIMDYTFGTVIFAIFVLQSESDKYRWSLQIVVVHIRKCIWFINWENADA